MLELCVLAVLRKEDSYGYQIIKDFHLTEEGRQYLKNFDKDRAQLSKILDYIAEEDEK